MTTKCSHWHRDLRGCTLPQGHICAHTNKNAHDGFTWNNHEGSFVRSKRDWHKHIETFVDYHKKKVGT